MLDMLDRKILFELDRDPLQSFSSIARRVEAPKSTVNSRLRRLFETGIIREIIPVVDVDKLGFGVYLVNLRLHEVDSEAYNRIIGFLVEHPNIAWVVRCRGPWTIMIAIFARDLGHYTRVLMEVADACHHKLKSYDTFIVYEKYILGQRYLLIADRYTDFVFDDSRIYIDGSDVKELNEEDYLILERIRENARDSASFIARQLDLPQQTVVKRISRLKQLHVIKKYQPVFDPNKMGYEWHEVFIRFKNLTEARRRNFVNVIHSIPEVIHINLCVGNWDANFELHVRNESEFEYVYSEVKEDFDHIIQKDDHIVIEEEYKFSFLIDAVLKKAGKYE